MKQLLAITLFAIVALVETDRGQAVEMHSSGSSNVSLAAIPKNGTILKDDTVSRINTSTALIMLSVEIIKNGNRTNNTSPKDTSEILVIDGDRSDEMSLLETPKASPYFPRFSEISMKTLYLIVCMCLAILLLMIVKLLVSRRERKKDYDLVTKGEFDA
ncbi:hypothetical protein P5673_027455 [Acropora cervicornis]|uniref:Uncharacterized protein n=1 Tax=Acropora cervicornis TaxID=6130 RepID=A0AAD9PZ10_ACRCE|nr:hypothetical protein P5673_027455 [Acropora cervicornis]